LKALRYLFRLSQAPIATILNRRPSVQQLLGKLTLGLLGAMAALAGAVPAWGQASDQAPDTTYTIEGQIINAETQEPVDFAQFVVPELKKGVNTQQEGRFKIELPPGTWGIEVRSLNLQKLTDTLEVDGPRAGLTFRVKPEAYAIDETVIRYRNPAKRIMRLAIEHREENKVGHMDSYSFESYNKLTISFDNITQDKLDNLILRPAKSFIEEHANDSALLDTASINKHDIDTLEGEGPDKRYRFTAFMSETISDVYFQTPDQRKEVIKASRISGFKSTEMNLLSDRLTHVELYTNTVDILGRQFISPLAKGAFLNYEFKKIGQRVNGVDSTFVIKVIPKNDFSPTFQGRLWIENGDWAMRRADLSLNTEPNINFIENILIKQAFDKIEGRWLPVMRSIEIDAKNPDRGFGLRGKNVSYRDSYRVNPDFPPQFFEGAVVEHKQEATQRDSSYWQDHRMAGLNQREAMSEELIKDLKTKSIWTVYTTVAQLLTTGSKKVGDFYLGPYSNLIGFNQVEGWRTQAGAFTAESFHPRWFLAGWGAYGFRDKRWKYKGEVRYKFHMDPLLRLTARRYNSIEQAGYTNYEQTGSDLLTSLLRNVPLRNMNYYRENEIKIDGDIAKGVVGEIYGRTKFFEPAFDFQFDNGDAQSSISNYNIAELGATVRFSFNEDYILKNGERVYFGSNWPEFYVEGKFGFEGVLGGDFDYQHVALTMTDVLELGRFGWMNYTFSGGKIFGTVPFPSLYVYRGSQTYGMQTSGYSYAALTSVLGNKNYSTIYDPVAFNLMYYFEFIADEYVVGGVDYHTEGWLWRKIPLLRQLKWKELFSARLAWGRLSAANRSQNIFRTADGQRRPLKAPAEQPYVEVGVGIENILKVFRIDYVWRLTYRDPSFFDRANLFNYNHGLRFNFALTF
jgi:hypothetical protein